MIYILTLFMIGCGYYTMTYGINIWKKEKNKTASISTCVLAIVGTILPIIVMFLKR